MNNILEILEIIAREGFIYGILALGIYLSNYILDFPDLTTEASFPLGACMTACLIINGCDPILALLIAFICGGILGIITAILHTKLKISNILSSILVLTAGYSINLIITEGSVLLPFYNKKTIFNVFEFMPNEIYTHRVIIISLFIIIVIKVLLDLLLKTRIGLLLRAVGNNKKIINTIGERYDRIIILGLFVSNGLVALSGSVLSQAVESANVNLGTGMFVLGLTSVIIGMKIFFKLRISNTTKVIVGAIIYKLCLYLAMQIGLPTNLLKLIMSVLLILLIVLNNAFSKEKKIRFIGKETA